jgi:hypothetical protein
VVWVPDDFGKRRAPLGARHSGQLRGVDLSTALRLLKSIDVRSG